MDRQVLVHIVAVALVLATLVTWLPGDGQDLLGQGVRIGTIQMDSRLAEMGPDGDRARIFLRTFKPSPSNPERDRWRQWLGQVRTLQARATEDTRLQFKGMPRNVLWFLAYDAYPVRTTFHTVEEGSRPSDATLPDHAVINGGYVGDPALAGDPGP